MTVELLQTLSLISYIIGGVLFLVAVVLFFYLKVPALWGEVTGRTARKAINAMKWNNEDSTHKPLPEGLSLTPTSSKLTAKIAKASQSQDTDATYEENTSKDQSPLVAPNKKPLPESTPDTPSVSPESSTDPVELPVESESESNSRANTPAEASGGMIGETSDLHTSSIADSSELIPSGIGETAVLSQEGIGETAVLSQVGIGETAVLSQVGIGETAVLSQAGIGETAVLSQGRRDETGILPQTGIGETAVLNTTSYAEFIIRSTGELPRQDETTLLDQKQIFNQEKTNSVLFVLEKELAFTDSTEIIE